MPFTADSCLRFLEYSDIIVCRNRWRPMRESRSTTPIGRLPIQFVSSMIFPTIRNRRRTHLSIPFSQTKLWRAEGGTCEGLQGPAGRLPARHKKGAVHGFFIHIQRLESPCPSPFSPCTKTETGGIIETAMCR